MDKLIDALSTTYYPSFYFSDEDHEKVVRKDLYSRVFKSDIDGIAIHFYEDGSIVFETTNEEKALTVANTIFASTALLFNRGCLDVGELELIKLKIEPISGKKSDANICLVSCRNYLNGFPDVKKEITVATGLHSRAYFKVDAFSHIVDFAKIVYSSKRRDIFLTEYHSYSEKERGNWFGCFVLAWMAIEMFLNEQIRIHLSSEGVSKNLQDDFLNDDMGISKIIDYLQIECISKRLPGQRNLDTLTYDYLAKADGMRKIRNRIIHEGHQPTKKEAIDCYLLADRVAIDCIRLEDLNLEELRDYVKPLRGPFQSPP